MSANGCCLYRAEMGYSRRELLRELPSAVSPYETSLQDDGVVAISCNGRLARLVISNDRNRRIGSLSLPVIDVTIDFENFTERQYAEFVERFRTRLHRGGG
ncbi:MAG: hypothetical protein F4244_06630 [Gammaproteobacteria bacterium]|nr:hypothetical protein [Gammaproteobacteria bacterium]